MVQEFLAPLGSTGGGKNPARSDLAEKFREGVSKEKDLGEFSGG
jgi:hypothetical protein